MEFLTMMFVIVDSCHNKFETSLYKILLNIWNGH